MVVYAIKWSHMTKRSNIKQSSNVVSESQLLFFSQINKLILLIKSYKILCENTEVLFIEVGYATIWTIYSNLCCRN